MQIYESIEFHPFSLTYGTYKVHTPHFPFVLFKNSHVMLIILIILDYLNSLCILSYYNVKQSRNQIQLYT